MDNIVQQLIQAALALHDNPLAHKARNAAWKGFASELPKQAEKLGKLISKLLVWGPICGAASALAVHFSWFAPLAKLLGKMLG